MRYLFSEWDSISSRLQKFLRIFLFFDYDGTLSPIVSTPYGAIFPARVKNLIKNLQKNSKFIIAIISGRSLKDIKKMVRLKGIIYAGNHGLEIEGQGIRFLRHLDVRSAMPIIRRIDKSLRKELSCIKGVIVENKCLTLSVHYRVVRPKYKRIVKKVFHRTLAPFLYSGKVRISSGKEVLEVRPNIRWDKGMAVTWLLKRHREVLAVYVGDDVTDCDAFRAIKGKGISIFVGSPRKAIGADYFLKGPKDVERFIEKLQTY